MFSALAADFTIHEQRNATFSPHRHMFIVLRVSGRFHNSRTKKRYIFPSQAYVYSYPLTRRTQGLKNIRTKVHARITLPHSHCHTRRRRLPHSGCGAGRARQGCSRNGWRWCAQTVRRCQTWGRGGKRCSAPGHRHRAR